MRIFKNKSFARFARKARLADADLCKAVWNAEQGLIDADLGGGVLKQRIARPGGGKSGGFRTIILFRAGTRAFFVRKRCLKNISPAGWCLDEGYCSTKHGNEGANDRGATG